MPKKEESLSLRYSWAHGSSEVGAAGECAGLPAGPVAQQVNGLVGDVLGHLQQHQVPGNFFRS